MLHMKDTDLKIEVSELVQRVSESIINEQEDFGEYTVESISIRNLERKARGFTAVLSVKFMDGTTEDLDLPIPDIEG